MGSRSKFHKTVKAMTRGRILLHGKKRPPRQKVTKFADALEDAIRAQREDDLKRTPEERRTVSEEKLKSFIEKTAERRAPSVKLARAERRAEIRETAKFNFHLAEDDCKDKGMTRAERKRSALEVARRPPAQVRA